MSEEKKSGARSVVLIGNALLWAAAMIASRFVFPDQAWGGDLFLWLLVGFTLSNGLLMLAFRGKSRGC